jgi:hypothetical protein
LLRVCHREFFEDEECVFIPSRDELDADWAAPAACLWEAPEEMLSFQPLMALYTKAFSASRIDINRLAGFFRNTLGIPDMSWTHAIEELEALKDDDNPGAKVASIRRLYEWLDQSDADENAIR